MSAEFRRLYLADPQPEKLEVRGVSRDVRDPDPEARRMVMVFFNREPSDNELRAFHEYVRFMFLPPSQDCAIRSEAPPSTDWKEKT